MLTIAISHNIFLTQNELVSLSIGEPVETIGVSLPVWFFRGNTSEPAQEVFCEYKLTNIKEDYPVTIFAKGYRINLPQIPAVLSKLKKPSKERWKEMTISEKEDWRQENPISVTGEDLLDLDEENPFHFKKYNKIKEGDRRMNCIHAIEISTFELLNKSLTF
jgi:hypothetical protein